MSARMALEAAVQTARLVAKDASGVAGALGVPEHRQWLRAEETCAKSLRASGELYGMIAAARASRYIRSIGKRRWYPCRRPPP